MALMEDKEQGASEGPRHRFPLPAAIRRASHDIGRDLATWRRLRGLTATEVAARAGISRSTLTKIEAGAGGTSVENVLRVARVLGILDPVVAAFDPYSSDVGRLRADERLPVRVRRPRPPESRQ